MELETFVLSVHQTTNPASSLTYFFAASFISSYNGIHSSFAGQLYIRTLHGELKIPNNCAKVRSLVKASTQQTSLPYLTPITFANVVLHKTIASDEVTLMRPEARIFKIVNIPNDAAHVISISSSALKIWNLYKGKFGN